MVPSKACCQSNGPMHYACTLMSSCSQHPQPLGQDWVAQEEHDTTFAQSPKGGRRAAGSWAAEWIAGEHEALRWTPSCPAQPMGRELPDMHLHEPLSPDGPPTTWTWPVRWGVLRRRRRQHQWSQPRTPPANLLRPDRRRLTRRLPCRTSSTRSSCRSNQAQRRRPRTTPKSATYRPLLSIRPWYSLSLSTSSSSDSSYRLNSL